ncbi:hypothetical protein MHBO_003397 [Bonamia ostreae]|uniref:Uncharacterized protein n=1 Tax=Bonamia ostreae TaxID=126728 RepID=A0ABV2AR80_9EUKA
MIYVTEKIMSHKKSFKKENTKKWENFLHHLNLYRFFYNFESFLYSVGDTSFLWFKEHNLSFSKCIQFPTHLSLPGTLFDFVTKMPKNVNFIFGIFKIYDDSAISAITVFKKKHLYEEIESEFSLLFDQFLYKFSRIIVNTALSFSARKKIPKWVKKGKDDNGNFKKIYFYKLLNISKTHTFDLLGRKIDLNRLITQQINHHLREALDYEIGRFEALGILASNELVCALDVFEEAVMIIRKELPINDFQPILEEVNESVGMYNFKGRIFNTMNESIIDDVFPNFAYSRGSNSFVRVNGVEEEKQRDIEKKFDRFEIIYGKFHKLYRKKFGKVAGCLKFVVWQIIILKAIH